MLELVVGLLVTAGLAPVVRAQMLRHNFLDIPNQRSSHSIPTPRAGGVACLGGVVAAGAAAMTFGHDVAWAPLGGAAALSLIGLWDDRADLPALWRLLGQSLMGALVGLAVGGLWPLLAGLVLFPAVVNATNFMDGINGITGLTMGLWGLSTFLVGMRSDLDALAGLGGLTVGAALGFLPFNAPAARLFLGDVGSYLFGGLVAGGLLLGWALDAPVAPLLAPLSIYAADTATSLVRRLSRGERITEAHKEHVYQRLTSATRLPHLIVATWASGLAALATLAWWAMDPWPAAVATVLLCALYLCSPVPLRSRAERAG